MIRTFVIPFAHPVCNAVSMKGAKDATGTVSNALVGWTVDGNYPSGTSAGDVVIVSMSTVNSIPPSMPSFTQIGTGSIGTWGYYFSFQRTAPSALSGFIAGTDGIVVMTLRGVSSAKLVSSFNPGSTWASLSSLTANSNIYAVGFSDTAGAHGGASFPSTFTTQVNSSRQVLATLSNLNAGTTFAYTGCSNNGTTAAMCFSYGIA